MNMLKKTRILQISLSNFKQSQQNKGEVDMLGPLTITYDNINEVVVDEENRNFLLQDRIDTNEFEQVTILSQRKKATAKIVKSQTIMKQGRMR